MRISRLPLTFRSAQAIDDQVVAGEQLGARDDDQDQPEAEDEPGEQAGDAERDRVGGAGDDGGREHRAEGDEGAGEHRKREGRAANDMPAFATPMSVGLRGDLGRHQGVEARARSDAGGPAAGFESARSRLMLRSSTRTAVTLYSGQHVTSSPCWEVSRLASASGKWKAMNTWPGETRSVTLGGDLDLAAPAGDPDPLAVADARARAASSGWRSSSSSGTSSRLPVRRVIVPAL